MATVTSSDGFQVTTSNASEEEIRASLGVTAEPEIAESETEPTPALTEEPKPAKEPRAAKPRDDPFARVKDATAKEAAAKRERDEARTELERLKAENARLSQQYQAPREEPKPAAPIAPEKFPAYQDMIAKEPDLTPEEWLDRRDEWRDTRRAETESRRRAEESHLSRVKSLNDKIGAAEAAEPGFWASVLPFASTLVPAKELKAGQQLTGRNSIADVILDADNPEKLLKYFRDNPNDLQRISTLHPVNAFREMGKLEQRLDAAPSTGSARQAPIVSQASAPLKPVSASPPISDDSAAEEDLPFDEFARRGNDRQRKRASH